MPTKHPRLILVMPQEQLDSLDNAVKKLGMTKSDIARQAIREYLQARGLPWEAGPPFNAKTRV